MMNKIIPALTLDLITAACTTGDADHKQMCTGPYQPTWKSLSQWHQVKRLINL